MRAALVWCSHSSHRHVGAVQKEYKDSHEAHQSTEHAETDDATATQVQLLHNVATQEGATPSSRYHHIAFEEKMLVYVCLHLCFELALCLGIIDSCFKTTWKAWPPMKFH